MKIFGMTADSPLSQKVINCVDPADVTKYEDVEGEGVVNFDEVHMMHMGSERNFRPYMQMIGTVKSFKPQSEKLPYGIDSIDFGRNAPEIMYQYMFTDEELKQLIDLGYYNKGFRVPDIFTTESFELPIKFGLTVVAPEDKAKPVDATNIPLVVASIGDVYALDINGATSGYENLAKYFKPALEKYSETSYDGVNEVFEDIEDIRQLDEPTGEDALFEEDVEAELAQDVEEGLFGEEPEVDESEFEGVAEDIKTEDEIEDDMYARLQDMRTEDEIPDIKQPYSKPSIEDYRRVFDKEAPSIFDDSDEDDEEDIIGLE